MCFNGEGNKETDKHGTCKFGRINETWEVYRGERVVLLLKKHDCNRDDEWDNLRRPDVFQSLPHFRDGWPDLFRPGTRVYVQHNNDLQALTLFSQTLTNANHTDALVNTAVMEPDDSVHQRWANTRQHISFSINELYIQGTLDTDILYIITDFHSDKQGLSGTLDTDIYNRQVRFIRNPRHKHI